MKKWITGAVLLGALSGAFAASLDDSETNLPHESVTHKLASQGKHDVDAFQQIMTDGSFFAMLLSISTELPEIARAGEYVMLINELHLMNEKLSVIAGELQHANRSHEEAA